MRVPGVESRQLTGRPETGRVIIAEVTSDELAAAEMVRELHSPVDGAFVSFEGRVRNRNAGREVLRLHYDSYDEMAEVVLGEIALEAADRFDASAVIIRHRTGALAPGEVSLVVVVRAVHRANAFDASRYVVEELKTRVPIWKREEYTDGTSGWLDGHASGRPGADGEV